MTSLVSQPRFHGETYHLTNPTPTTVQAMKEVIVRALEELDWSRAGQNSGAASFIANGAATTDFVGAFREQMQIYQSYWSDDPQFDSSATEAALPGLPCPEITGEVMLELARYAIKANFGWPPETPVVPAYDVGSRLTKWLRATPAERGGQGQSQFVSLQVSGQGGGQWHLAVDRGRLVGAGVGLRNGSSPTCYLTSATFARLARGELTIEDSIHRGRLVVAGAALPTGELARVLTDLLSEEKTTNGLG
jgi:hypothetical protein